MNVYKMFCFHIYRVSWLHFTLCLHYSVLLRVVTVAAATPRASMVKKALEVLPFTRQKMIGCLLGCPFKQLIVMMCPLKQEFKVRILTLISEF